MPWSDLDLPVWIKQKLLVFWTGRLLGVHYNRQVKVVWPVGTALPACSIWRSCLKLCQSFPVAVPQESPVPNSLKLSVVTKLGSVTEQCASFLCQQIHWLLLFTEMNWVQCEVSLINANVTRPEMSWLYQKLHWHSVQLPSDNNKRKIYRKKKSCSPVVCLFKSRMLFSRKAAG